MAAIAPPAATAPAPTAAASASGSSKRQGPFRDFLDRMYPFGYIAPSVGFMVIATILPILFTIVVSMTNFSSATIGCNVNTACGKVLMPPLGWVGAQDFIRFLSGQVSTDCYSDLVELGACSKAVAHPLFTSTSVVGYEFVRLMLWSVLYAVAFTFLIFIARSLVKSFLKYNTTERQSPAIRAAGWIIFGGALALVWALPAAVALAETGHARHEGTTSTVGFSGLKNFVDIFAGNSALTISDFLHLAVWTFAFAAVATALAFIGGLLLANLLNNDNLRERNLYRTILIIPWALPGAIAVVSWRSGILNQPFGLLHNVLSSLGLPDALEPQFTTDPNWARFVVFLVGFWFGYPFMMTACLGALQSISPEVLQAAEIDGANVFQRFFQVTLPLLRSATLPLIISTFAYNLNNFGLIYLLTGGGPPIPNNGYYGYTDTLPTAVYNLAFSAKIYYLACAFGVLLFVLIGGVSAINMKISGAFEEVNR